MISVFYSVKYDALVTTEIVGKGVCWNCDDELAEVIKSYLNRGVGFIFIDDWIFVGEV